ncbi:insulinase family protein [Helicobacter didelphidarum]|uniref:Insulinase family protein n=1 Tax=Helicobacter didelphidarum TaxID=2040648 RepID=A0A3D8IRE8_9HELI|nr:pitrilysin family protein [Helicobacter didelphidarum]RDU67673.1 insulinase family protein [Helicobacter didelphidarum]
MIKQLCIFLILLGASVMSATDNKVQYIQMNGVKIPVISEFSNNIPIGHVEIVFVGGGNVFNPSKQPLSEVSKNLLNYGTKELGNVGFASLLESKAIGLSATTTGTTLNFELDFLKEYEDFAYTQLASLLSNPNLTPKALKDIQVKLRASLMSKSADFDYQARVLLHKNIFAKTPLAYPSLGNSANEIDSVTLQDVQNYLDTNLVLERMIIVIGGDLDIQKSLAKLQKILEKLPRGKKVDIPHYTIKTTPIKTLKKDTQQAFIYFASPLQLQSIRDEAYKAQVAGFILGSSGFGSRLMEEIRVKRGLAYSAYMYPNITRVSVYFTGQMQTALDKQDEAIKITQDILKEFVAKGVTQEELDSAKQFILGNKPLREETLEQRLNAKFMNYYNDLPLDYREEFIKKVEQLSLTTLNEYIKLHPEIAELTFAIIRN